MQSEGEYRVGVDFNPSQNDDVSAIKLTVAGLIGLVLRKGRDERTNAIAATSLEEAAMWAVKSNFV